MDSDAGGRNSSESRGFKGAWDFEAPMYVDFASMAQPGVLDLDYEIDDSSYFSVDHECHHPIDPLASASCIRSMPFDGSTGSSEDMISTGGSLSSTSDAQSLYSEYHSSPGLDNGRYMDVVPGDPQGRALGPRKPDIIGSPSEDLDYTSDEEEDVGKVTGTWLNAPTGKPAKHAGEAGRSPAPERGRQRFVAIVTSAKKRLSMSVDRGNRKLADMKQALREATNLRAGPNQPSNLPPTGKLTRFGSTEDMANGARRRLLSNVESLSLANPNHTGGSKAGGEAGGQKQKVPGVRRSVATTGYAENIVQALKSGNEIAISENMSHSRIPVPHRGIPFSQTVTKLTVVQPFSFWQRDARMIENKEKKRLQVIAEEKKVLAREFHAQPYPDIIYRSTRTLDNSASGSSVISKTSHPSEKSKFKARPPTVLSKPPFIPHKSSKPPTEILKKFESGPASRSEKVKALEAARKERAARDEEERAERDRRKKEAEQAEVRHLRQQTVHRAQPMPAFIRAGSVRRSVNGDVSKAMEAKSGAEASAVDCGADKKKGDADATLTNSEKSE